MKVRGSLKMLMKIRDRKMDVFKGLLVIGMVYCHLIQFFVNTEKEPVINFVTFYINVVTFSGFVFTFGYTSYLAYFSKSFKQSYQKMLITFVRLLGVFYISGLSYRVLAERRPYFKGLLMPILLLEDIPGWSEFIVSFALLMLVGLVFFKPIKLLLENKLLFWIITPLLLISTWLPYEIITDSRLGLLVGTTRFASFPVLQYLPYYLLGIYFVRYQISINKWVIIVATVLTGIALLSMSLNQWAQPDRFPPSIFWIILPALPLVIYYYIGHFIQHSKWSWNWLFLLGQNSIIYLLLSNIIIFALSGVKAIRGLDSIGAVVINIVILSVISLIIQMSRPINIR